MGTWLEQIGLGENDTRHNSSINDYIYGAFWVIRHVRADRASTYTYQWEVDISVSP